MTQNRAYADYLQDILEAIEQVKHFIEGLAYDQFAQDTRTVYAVIHALKLLGRPPNVCLKL